MNKWFHTLFQSDSVELGLEVQLTRRDTVLYREQFDSAMGYLRIGRANSNAICLETPSLPMQHFTLVEFCEKEPWVQFTSTMSGTLRTTDDLVTIEELKHTPLVHPTLHGYRIHLRAHTTLMLHLDQLTFRFRRSYEHNQHPPFGGFPPIQWLTSPPRNCLPT